MDCGDGLSEFESCFFHVAVTLDVTSPSQHWVSSSVKLLGKNTLYFYLTNRLFIFTQQKISIDWLVRATYYSKH